MGANAPFLIKSQGFAGHVLLDRRIGLVYNV